jgi:hypothetical protein
MNVCPACACAAVAHARAVTEAAHGPLQRKLEIGLVMFDVSVQ